jgi:transposase-like protein
MFHILLMRLLAGCVSDFFAGTDAEIPVFKPYGDPPYPCRNTVCPHYLQDVIESIEVTHTEKGDYKAMFTCPHCGFMYRRKKPLPKEKQYSGQVDIVDYGRLWHKTLSDLLYSGVSINKIARTLRCDTRTVVKLGIRLGYFPPEQYPKQRLYIPQYKEPLSSDEQREHYRKRWLEVMKEHPTATRNELRLIDSKADQWLHVHDAEWLAENSPKSQKAIPVWSDKDDEYAERIEKAMEQIRASPGRPKRMSLAAIGKVSGIPKIGRMLMADGMPRTKALLETGIESLEQWQHRKILWAIQQMRERGEVITVYKVRHRASIEDPLRKLDEFIAQSIMNNE